MIQIKPRDVINQARKQDLNVQSIEDFRKQRFYYDRIEKVMDTYRNSFARYSVLGGLTTGIGGLTTAVTFAGLDSISLAVQLYRLAQRFAILNGFDGREPLQKDKILNIYFGALAINGVIKAILKRHLLQADTLAAEGKASETLLLKIIIRAAGSFGADISSKEAGRLIPIIGGLEGAVINYTLAQRTGTKMQKDFKRAYFSTWQGEEIS